MSPNSYEVGFVPKYESESCNLFCSYQPALERNDKVCCLKTNIHISVHLTNKNVYNWKCYLINIIKNTLEYSFIAFRKIK